MPGTINASIHVSLSAQKPARVGIIILMIIILAERINCASQRLLAYKQEERERFTLFPAQRPEYVIQV